MKLSRFFPSLSSLLICACIFGFLFYLFDSYLASTAKEMMANWIKTEEVAILENNLLTSVTKNQKTLLSSEFLKGVVLIDFSKPNQLEQIEFGEKIDISKINQGTLTDRPQILNVGLFKKYSYVRLPHADNLVIVFSIWSSGIGRLFLLSSLLLAVLFVFQTVLISRIKKSEYQKRTKQTNEYAEKAARVAHDIRTPLLVLQTLIEATDGEPEVKKNLAFVSKRLNEITKDLIESRRNPAKESMQVSSVSKAVKSFNFEEELKMLIENKKIQYANRPDLIFQIATAEVLDRLAMDPTELFRILSNVLDNAVEACPDRGSIEINASLSSGKLNLEIKDNGVGIPKEILASIGTKGFSHGKTHGSGLGVYYAKLACISCGGDFSITSQEGSGTRVILEIPFSQTKVINSTTIQIESGANLLVLDDDKMVHESWKKYFEVNPLPEDVKVTHFSSSKEMKAFAFNLQRVVLLTDFDLKDEKSGLDTVAELGLSGSALLITGQADDVTVRALAVKMGVPILSKERMFDLKVVIA